MPIDGPDDTPTPHAAAATPVRSEQVGHAGPARWVALGVLAGGSLTGLVWSLSSQSTPAVERQVPRVQGPEIQGTTPDREALSIPAPASRPTQSHAGATSTETAAIRKLVNLNTATLAELDSLPGIGQVTARAILDYRARHGAFRVLSDLDKIKGIGPATIERLRPLVTVDNPPAAGSP